MATKKKIGLILFSKNTEKLVIEKVNTRFMEEIELAGFELHLLYYNLFSVFFEKDKVEVYYENKKINPKDYQCMIGQYYFLNADFSNNMFIVEALRSLGIKIFNTLEAVSLAKNKRDSTFVLSRAGLPIVPTGINFSQFFLDQQLNHFGKDKIVAKSNNGSMGYGVSVLDSKISFISFMEFIGGGNYQPVNILVQPFIKANNEDYRIFVVGNKVIAGMRRKANGIEFRANVSKGGEGTGIKVPKAMSDLAIKAVKILKLDYAGVDIIKSKNKLMIVEVNPNPGFKIENATNINVVAKVVAHCIKQSK